MIASSDWFVTAGCFILRGGAVYLYPGWRN
jgi:hypothetical protein